MESIICKNRKINLFDLKAIQWNVLSVKIERPTCLTAYSGTFICKNRKTNLFDLKAIQWNVLFVKIERPTCLT